MKKHQQRLLLIVILAAVCLIALVVAGLLGAPASVLTAITGALALLVPAAIDAAMVEKRRKTPGQKAVEDDQSS